MRSPKGCGKRGKAAWAAVAARSRLAVAARVEARRGMQEKPRGETLRATLLKSSGASTAVMLSYNVLT
jgi:hypothetical protein